MKKIVAILLTLSILLSLTPAALAADPPVKAYSAVPTEGTPANGSVGSAEGSQMVAMMDDGIQIITWRNSIEEHSPNYLKLYCLTISDVIADKLDNNYELQRWNGSSWVAISTSNNSTTYTDYFPTNIYRSVSSGYYYRVKTVHKAWLGLYLSTKTLYSSYIYVS